MLITVKVTYDGTYESAQEVARALGGSVTLWDEANAGIELPSGDTVFVITATRVEGRWELEDT